MLTLPNTMLTLPNFRIFIQTLKQTVETFVFNPLILNKKELSLDSMRKTLSESVLGDDDRDIFFPSWTKTIHVMHLDDLAENYTPTYEEIMTKRLLIEDSDQLVEAMNKADKHPGSVSIILQECRSKRYTRKPILATHENEVPTSPVSAVDPGSPPKADVPKFMHQHHQPHYVPPMYPQDGYGGGIYFDPMMQSYGLVPPTMFTQPYFVHYGLGCVPYGYVAPGYVQPVMPPPGYHFGY